MLEAIASAVLSKVLGDYVKGFEAKNIKFSWSGELTLKNLELSPMAIDSFDLPIKLKSGTLGMLHMTIPWRELGIKPSIIRIERLFVIAGPRSPTEVMNSFGISFGIVHLRFVFAFLFFGGYKK
jgi:vacuolar protein sorting-associated protein 13A/C